MSAQMFQVVVNGKLVEGADVDQVKQHVAKLFKTNVEKIAPMFSGKAIAIKKGIDQQTAKKYQAALKKAGLIAAIAPMPGQATHPPEQTPTVTKKATATLNASIAPAGAVMDETPRPTTPDIDTSNLNVSMAGEDLVEHEVIPEPEIDISTLNMGAVGEDIVEHEVISEPEIDTSNLKMAEVGADIMTHKPVPEPEIDISKLKLNDIT